jgi:predicted Zn-dependent protease
LRSQAELGNEETGYDEAVEAFARGEYGRAAELTRELKTDVRAVILHVRALANLDTAGAERACAEAALRHPLSAELRYLQAVLLLELGREEEAGRAARRVIYLDRSLALGHFTLGSIETLATCARLGRPRKSCRSPTASRLDGWHRPPPLNSASSKLRR